MRTQNRTERKIEERADRKEAAKAFLNSGPQKPRRRIKLFNILTLLSIMLVLLTLLVLSKSDVLNAGSFAGAKLDKYMLYRSDVDFRNAYEENLSQELYVYKYDKSILESIKSGVEISFKQNTTEKTNSLIGIFEGENKQIEKVGVIGVYQEDNGHFALGFKENAILLTSIINKINYDQAENYLKSKNIIDPKGDILLKSVIFEDEGREYIFYVENNAKFFYTIQSKKNLVEK